MHEHIPLDDLEIYQLAMEIGDIIWEKVEGWKWLAQKTIGEQVIRSGDSIAANIAEGYGRYFFKERKQFCYYGRGSILETKTWIIKAFRRKLITEQEYNLLLEKLQSLHYKINIYIKKLKQEHPKEE
jgi:four helix bundle protein